MATTVGHMTLPQCVVLTTAGGAAASPDAEVAEPTTGLAGSPANDPAGSSVGSGSTVTGAQLQAAHQRLCAVLLVKLMRRLLELDPHEMAVQLARRVTSTLAHVAAGSDVRSVLCTGKRSKSTDIPS